MLDFTCFKGSRCDTDELAAVLRYYADHNPNVAPRVLECSSQTKVGERKVEFVFNKMRDLEASAGKKHAKSLEFQGDLECDAHGVRSMWVSRNNPHYRSEVAEVLRTHPGCKDKAFKLWLRVAGICARAGSGGKLAISVIGDKLVLPNSKPPPESVAEVRESRLLTQTKRDGVKSVLFHDGIESWKSVAREQAPWLMHRNVVHSKLEFTRPVETPRSRSSLAGTQSLDKRWDHLDNYIPPQIAIKWNHGVHETIWQYVFSWLWRHNRPHSDMRKLLGGLCVEWMREHG